MDNEFWDFSFEFGRAFHIVISTRWKSVILRVAHFRVRHKLIWNED